jgi:hypothetical protein
MRASALLIRELYSCILREAENLEIVLESGDNVRHAASIPFAMAMVSSKEERLYGVITQYVRGVAVVTSNHQIADSTTSKRCEEAMTLRATAEEKGIFAAAMLTLDEQTALAKLPSILKVVDDTSDPIQISPRESLEE